MPESKITSAYLVPQHQPISTSVTQHKADPEERMTPGLEASAIFIVERLYVVLST
jgi:hypothetical protein